jgi:hypothetical protein
MDFRVGWDGDGYAYPAITENCHPGLAHYSPFQTRASGSVAPAPILCLAHAYGSPFGTLASGAWFPAGLDHLPLYPEGTPEGTGGRIVPN